MLFGRPNADNVYLGIGEALHEESQKDREKEQAKINKIRQEIHDENGESKDLNEANNLRADLEYRLASERYGKRKMLKSIGYGILIAVSLGAALKRGDDKQQEKKIDEALKNLMKAESVMLPYREMIAADEDQDKDATKHIVIKYEDIDRINSYLFIASDKLSDNNDNQIIQQAE